MDRLSQMETFVRICETGSFSVAAERLCLSRGVVSRHVKHLEERLGARLINRNTRSLSLTEPGRAYAQRQGRRSGRRRL